MRLDVQCLERSVGTMPENGDVRVCAACAAEAERDLQYVTYYESEDFANELANDRLIDRPTLGAE